jgi:hypothetical protein
VVTFILCVVAELDHKYDDPALDVNVTLPPVQNVVNPPAVIVGAAGNGFTVTEVATEALLRHPLALVT